ncbi:periplasmic heavy metal sensor [Defluviimonas sp. SAOS-178_SWC]|uniref:periplasmic heavy metal sensor n=1 Tax=Defluviimonas sp. SAOS-178_SWC TaxID=3121287 RepID=UPI003221DF89
MADADGSKAKPGGRWMIWALIASLAVNLFVVATVVGAGMRHHRMPHGDVRDVGFGPFTEALTREDRAALRDAFIAAAPDFRDARRAAEANFDRLVASLRADPWDRTATEAVLAERGARTSERIELGRRLLVERLAAMTPEVRAALADRIEAAAARGWRKN